MKTATENTATQTKWTLDPTHSELIFSVKHLMITNVKGKFRKFSGEIAGEDPATSPITLRIDAASIFTNDDQRDGHLKSADFFDVEKYPNLTFKSTAFTKKDGDASELKGLLTVKGVTKQVTLDVTFGGRMKDPYGNEKSGFSVSGKINRKDFDLNWNTTLETGGVLVSDEVKIQAEVQFVKSSNENA